MQGVRDEEKAPGEFRSSQNWIGGAGSTLKNARYIPPSPEDIQNAMGDLEKYMNSEDSTNSLIRAALIHYQFETIHPFLDGNGRIGRLLITLCLMEKKVLTSLALYISYFLKKNRVEYYDRIRVKPHHRHTQNPEALGIAFNTVSSAVNRLVDAGILRQIRGEGRNRVFAYTAYLDILRKGT